MKTRIAEPRPPVRQVDWTDPKVQTAIDIIYTALIELALEKRAARRKAEASDECQR